VRWLVISEPEVLISLRRIWAAIRWLLARVLLRIRPTRYPLRGWIFAR